MCYTRGKCDDRWLQLDGTCYYFGIPTTQKWIDAEVSKNKTNHPISTTLLSYAYEQCHGCCYISHTCTLEGAWCWGRLEVFNYRQTFNMLIGLFNVPKRTETGHTFESFAAIFWYILSTPYNRVEHSDRIHHNSDTIWPIKTDGQSKLVLLICDLTD